MQDLTIFNNEQFGSVRTYTDGNTILFCASDVARALGYTNASKAISDHCRGVTKRYIPTKSGEQEMNFISRGDVYRLAARSKLDGAERFESWIFDEVVPSIHDTGGYQMQTNKPIKMSEVFQAMAQTAKIAEDASETAHAAMNGVTRLTAAQDAIEASVSSMDKKLDNVVDVLSAPKTTEAERWQRETHKAITSFCQENKLSYRDFYDNLYEQLEERAHVNLSSRVTRRQNRARWEGASRTEIYRITKLFMVSIDPKLRIIFDSLVTEFKIAYALKGVN